MRIAMISEHASPLAGLGGADGGGQNVYVAQVARHLPTGCGKSTLLHLLQRFYDPTWGEIRLDGIPLRRLLLADLRRQIGIVPQEPVVFQASLADNIRYGCPEADDICVEKAARGHSLSGGQRQRLALARSLPNQRFYCWTIAPARSMRRRRFAFRLPLRICCRDVLRRLPLAALCHLVLRCRHGGRRSSNGEK